MHCQQDQSNFPIRKQSSQKDNRLPCHSTIPPIQEINSSTGKSNNLQQEILHQWDLLIPFCSYQMLRRWGKPISAASFSGYHPPTGRQILHEGYSGRQSICFNIVVGLAAILTKYKSNLWQSDKRDRGEIKSNWIGTILREGNRRMETGLKNKNYVLNYFSLV